MGKDQVSEFARSLSQLLDSTGIFNRREWAEILGVSPAAISQWVNDVNLPRPELLRSIVSVLETVDQRPVLVLANFRRMASKSASDLTPLAHRFGEPTIADYMLRPLMVTLSEMLSTLTPELREEVVLKAIDLCDKLVPDQSEDDTMLHGALSFAIETKEFVPQRDMEPLFGRVWDSITLLASDLRDVFGSSRTSRYREFLFWQLERLDLDRTRVEIIVPEPLFSRQLESFDNLIGDAMARSHMRREQAEKLRRGSRLTHVSEVDFASVMGALARDEQVPSFATVTNLEFMNSFGYARYDVGTRFAILEPAEMRALYGALEGTIRFRAAIGVEEQREPFDGYFEEHGISGRSRSSTFGDDTEPTSNRAAASRR